MVRVVRENKLTYRNMNINVKNSELKLLDNAHGVEQEIY